MPVTAVDDLAAGTCTTRDREVTELGLSPSAGIVIHAGEEVRLAVRPSGTEPKLKLYLQVVLPVAPGAVDQARARAGAMLRSLGHEAEELIGR